MIVEDEKSAAKRLIALLKEIDPGIINLKVIDTVKATKEWLQDKEHPDLLFLDIQLADGLSFEIFENTEISCPVIFTTAYDQYALKAFEVYSLDYLLKPIEKEKLAKSIEKYKKIYGEKTQSEFIDINTLQNVVQMMKGGNYKERFIVKYGEHIKSVPTESISGFYSEEKITFFKTTEGRKYVIDYTLEQIETLVDQSKFFRINRKYIISLTAIEDVVVYSNSRLKLIAKQFQDMDLIVAREKVQEFKKWLDK